MKITNWIVEAVGWLLLLIAMYTFYTCFGFLNDGQVVEGGIGGAIGFAIFRGGLTLLRITIAGRTITSAAGG